MENTHSRLSIVKIFNALIIILFFILMVVPTHSSAKGKGQIVGTVKEASTNTPMPGANIVVSGTTRGAASDINGRFIIVKMPPGLYDITVSFLGYQDISKKVRINGSERVSIDFKLKETALKADEVVVYGKLSKGQAKSLNIQKNAANIKNVVSEEQFSVFPDNNAADAVKRIPSVTTTTDQGEGSYVQIRGMSPQYVAVTVNGVEVPSPSAIDPERKVGLDLIQADMFESITVTKALTPDMDGNALGGSVNFEFKGIPEKSYIKVKMNGGFNEQHSEFNNYGNSRYKLTGTGAKRFLDNKLGVLVSGTFYESNKGSILREWHYDDDTLGDSASVNWNKWTDYDIKRTRYGGIASADYQFSENSKVFVHYSHNTYLDDEIRRKTEFDGIKGRENLEVRNRLEDQKLDVLTLGGKHLVGDSNIDYTIFTSKTDETLPGRTYWRYRRTNLYLRTLSSDEMYNLEGFGEDPWTDLDSLYFRYMKYQIHNTKDNNFGGSFNLERPYMLMGLNNILKFGGKFSSKERSYTRQEYESLGGVTNELGTPAREYPFEDIRFDDPEAEALGFDFKIRSSDYDAENFTAKEDVLAAYAMTTVNFNNKLSLLTGARIEKTVNDYDYAGSYRFSDKDSLLTEDSKSDYVNVLPSFHFTYRFSKNINFRLALTTGLSRPAYSKLVPYNFVNDSDLEIKRGNPNLKPTTSKGIDLFFEKYSSHLGLFGVGIFYKALENQIGRHTTFEEIDTLIYKVEEPFNIDFGTIWGFEIGLNQSLRFLDIDFLKYYGIYINYTYTQAEAKFEIWNDDEQEYDFRELSFSENPPHIGNLGLTYDNPENGFMFAIIGNYRGKVIKEVGINEYTDIWYENEFTLDISLRKKLMKKVYGFVDLNNITDQGQHEVLGDPSEDYSHPYQSEYYGFIAQTGLSFKF